MAKDNRDPEIIGQMLQQEKDAQQDQQHPVESFSAIYDRLYGAAYARTSPYNRLRPTYNGRDPEYE